MRNACGIALAGAAALVGALMVGSIAAAMQPAHAQGSALAPADRVAFEFIDDEGRLRSSSGFAPAVVAVMFGYSNCPDVCPAALAKLAAARQHAGADADSFKVLYVTIDPKRDTRTFLQQYLGLFGEGFIGARALPSKLRTVAASFGAHFDAIETDRGTISITHTEDIYLLDHTGALAEILPGDLPLAEAAELIAGLVGQAQEG